MNSDDDLILRQLEGRRRALNERLMNSKTLAEANEIERELWAIRAAIRLHHNKLLKRQSPVSGGDTFLSAP